MSTTSSVVATEPRHRTTRLAGPDVTRAIALIGVVVMNYHGYLNGAQASAGPGATFAQRLFDPFGGVMATRFAATFVLVAGIGVTLLTNRSRLSGDRAAISDDRVRLVRRGLLLYAFGLVLDWVWPGTILFFYGAYFVVAAMMFTLRTRTIAIVGGGAAIAAAALAWWAAVRGRDGRPVSWLLQPGTLTSESPRGLLFDTLVNGTHPLLPWLAFLCAGIIVGRMLPSFPRRQVTMAAIALVAGSYVLSTLLSTDDPGDLVRNRIVSTRPFDRGLLYTIGAIGTAVLAYCVISWAADRFSTSPLIDAFGRAGRMTLTLYVLHVLVFNGAIELGWVGGTGLDTALVFALGFWLLAIAFAAWWDQFIGMGPLEGWYRRFGG